MTEEMNKDQDVTENMAAENQEKPVSEIETLKAQVEQLKDQLLRTVADSENVRKRMERQSEDMAKYAVSNFAKDLINVSENIHRALSSVTAENLENQFLKSLYDGVEMTRKELLNVFEKNKIMMIAPNIGDCFDHNIHQAVAHVDNADLKSGQISGVMQNGYMIHDRLLRPAMVAVVK
ncbi:MAG: nucleotide exchange factor GrpE [Alphaproteobacteria bacterium]|nr:nucleotide exchange factor GrpE [Alphaproteobacteria bacterium]OJV15798.1 MAG: nucleotide exchange factor GrpE [Alphaproteobacteria bacterium 33-17]